MIGEKLEDAPTKPVAHGATRTKLVAPAKAKAKAVAEAKARVRAKARAKEKVKVKAKAKRVANGVVKREDDLGLARPAAEHPHLREMAHLRVDDHPLRIRRKYVCCTRKGHARKATKTAHSYTIRRAYGTRQVDAEMGLSACSRTEPRKVYLPLNKSARS